MTGEEPAPAIPDELIARVRDGRAVPLIGAGLSCASGIASWLELVARLRKAVGARLGREIAEDELDLFQTPLLYSHLQGTRQPLYDLLGEVVDERFEPNSMHRLLAQMPVRSVLTTNWDQLIERAFDPIRPFHVVSDDMTVAGWNEAAAAQVIKLHGTIANPRSIVFSEDDYQRLYTSESALLNLVKAILATRSVFAIGFSMNDAYVKMLFSQVSRLAGDTKNPHYVIVPDAAPSDLRTEYLQAAGFIVVNAPTSEDDPHGLNSFLRELHRRTYSWAVNRQDRTQMLIRETKGLAEYLGPDRTIRIRATMGPLAGPEEGSAVFGDEDQDAAERQLRGLCMELVRNRGIKIRFIGKPTAKDFVLEKGYEENAYRERLSALIHAIEELGDRVEFAPTVRPTDVNTWIVADKAMIDSRKHGAEDQRLYDRAVLERNGELVRQASRWFDEEFENLVDRAGGAEKAREDLLAEAKAILEGGAP